MSLSVQNCAFSGEDNRMLFITAGGFVYRIQMKLQVFLDFRTIVDYNGDGIVDVEDLIVIAGHLFEEFPPTEEVE